MNSDDPAEPGRPVPLRLLLRILAVIGLTSLGGGRFALYHDAFVVKRGWLSQRDFIEGLTVSQVLPGPSFANLTVFISRRLGGWTGVFWGLVFILTPGAVLMIVLTHLYLLGTTDFPIVNNAFRGIGVAAGTVALVTVLRLLRPEKGAGDRDRSAWVLAGAAFVALGPLQLSMVWVVPPLLVVGLWIYRPGVSRGGD